MRTTYALTAAMLLAGSTLSIATGTPAAAQLLNDQPVSARAPGNAPMSFADLSERLQPAVVNISTKDRVQVGTAFDWNTGQRRPISEDMEAGGSGFFISGDGLLVTNNHVIVGPDGELADSITVTTIDGKEYDAELVGRDAVSDLAVLRVKGGNFPYVKMGDSNRSRVGDWVVAIGNPLGVGSTVTAGIISAVQRNTGAGGAYDRFIQTDTAINPGNSGGPLFNLNGEVVGINNRQFSLTRGNIGINFAIPASEALPVIESLKKGERPSRGYLGVGIRPVDNDTAATLGIDRNKGEFITRVQPGEAAEKAGIKEGDIVLSVNGKDVTPEQTLSYLIANIKPGEKASIVVLRKNQRRTVTATVGERPSEKELAESNFDPNEEGEADAPKQDSPSRAIYDAYGMTVMELTPTIARQLGVPTDTTGVVVDKLTRLGTAARSGLRRGDVIVSANYDEMKDGAALAAKIKEAKAAGRPGLLLGVVRRGAPVQYATIQFEER